MSRVAVSADKRFRRAHVKPTRPRHALCAWRRWLKHGIAALLVAYAAYRGVGLAAHAHVLAIDHIVVHGNQRMTSGEIMAVLAGLRGESLLRADLDRWRRRLLSSPWIRDADFRRSLPSTVDIVVTERHPGGIARFRDQLYLVDERGTVIDEYGPSTPTSICR